MDNMNASTLNNMNASTSNNMNASTSDNTEYLNQLKNENALMMNTIELLDEKRETILSEVLKCHVCLELPAGKQVRICEKGHHFCLSCHKKMEFCGICRGKLLEARNFVVEQLVTNLGAVLGTSSFEASEPPVRLSRGRYKCLHCDQEMAAYRMLPHLRSSHSAHLTDNVRSNPYSGRFSFRYDLDFVKDKKYIMSMQVSDMGLFTVEVVFSGSDFFGCVRALGDKTVSPLFLYQMVARIPNAGSESFLEFSLTQCPVSCYLDATDSVRNERRGLKIQGETLLEYIGLETTISIFFSVWKTQAKVEQTKISASVCCLPERHLHFESDRKVRRSKNRNMRRKRLKEKLKATSEDMRQLPKRMSRIVL